MIDTSCSLVVTGNPRVNSIRLSSSTGSGMRTRSGSHSHAYGDRCIPVCHPPTQLVYLLMTQWQMQCGISTEQHSTCQLKARYTPLPNGRSRSMGSNRYLPDNQRMYPAYATLSTPVGTLARLSYRGPHKLRHFVWGCCVLGPPPPKNQPTPARPYPGKLSSNKVVLFSLESTS